MEKRNLQLIADLALIVVTLVWGATFVSVKAAIQFIEPYYFLALRFALAAVILLVIANKRLARLTLPVVMHGGLIGMALFAGYAFQTYGLQYTTASNTGFITGLSVVLVPIFITITTRQFPGLFPSLGITIATTGLGLMTINASLQLNYGDILVLFCAVSYAVHIILVGKYSSEHDPLLLATVQIATVGVISFLAALFTESPPTAAGFNPQVWSALLITAVFATAMAFFLQTWMQKFTSPTHTAIIFTTEPVFAALFAYLLGGESFTLRQGLGAGLILTGMLTTDLGDFFLNNKDKKFLPV